MVQEKEVSPEIKAWVKKQSGAGNSAGQPPVTTPVQNGTPAVSESIKNYINNQTKQNGKS